ncbi:thymidine kinase-domain-containing protein [Ochromonadaceae sp. CCMP2298]|nr:thymidine kinase-domain-containing protein [Ochromonadaceae sp. CCMP2298]
MHSRTGELAVLLVTIFSFLFSFTATAMPKLYFRHGAVSSAKTLNLLAVAHNYRMQGKNIILMKPAMDTRFGEDNVTSRAGLSQAADYLLRPETDILSLPIAKGVHCILVDEAQFLNIEQIDQLRLVTQLWNVPVICYGLRTDFRTNLFPGSRRLLELADTIEEVKTTCHFCNAKAILNLKHVDGRADTSGPAVQLGAEEKYFPTCYRCYRDNVNLADQSPVSAWSAQAEKLLGGVGKLRIDENKENNEIKENENKGEKERGSPTSPSPLSPERTPNSPDCEKKDYSP